MFASLKKGKRHLSFIYLWPRVKGNLLSTEQNPLDSKSQSQLLDVHRPFFKKYAIFLAAMYPRRIIIPNNSCVHVTFRCHDRNFFLKQDKVKDFLIDLLAKYKGKYGIKIFDFAIMDNHVHLFVWTPDSQQLSDFMRTVESQLARYINKVYARDSQAIKDRFKSRVVIGTIDHYTIIQYIYLNRYKVDKTRPDEDYYCSAHWRKFKRYKVIENPKSDEDLAHNLRAKLLDDYIDLMVSKRSKAPGFIDEIVGDAIAKNVEILGLPMFSDPYTIGDEITRAYRKEQINAYKRETGPPSFH